jgi:hypothetical protein
MIPANMLKFYINGQWVDPLSTNRMGVENPATEEIVCEVALGNQAGSGGVRWLDGDAGRGAHRAAAPGAGGL